VAIGGLLVKFKTKAKVRVVYCLNAMRNEIRDPNSKSRINAASDQVEKEM
jgi:hypothetical protein